MQIQDIQDYLSQHGAKTCHQQRILRAWLNGKALDAGPKYQPAEHFLPISVRQSLTGLQERLDQLAQIKEQHAASDQSSSRLLLNLQDGHQVETVLLPRDGLCVSTQVGCAVGCLFCMTGKSGLLRQLETSEILAQVALARRQRPVKKVVFMGMGEPAHNLERVISAIQWLGTEGNIGHKNLVFSTVGDRRVFKRLPEENVKPALALSLHTTQAELRRKLLPQAPAIPIEELISLGETYARQTGHPIQYQWTLLAGINDTQAEMDHLLALLPGKYAVLNLIPYNSLEQDQYQRPSGERIIEMVHYLHSRGILTKVRDSAGQDVDAGCGQLRARTVQKAS